MKSISLIILAFSIYSLPFVQGYYIRKADKKFNLEFYAEAVQIYLKVASANDSNHHVISRLAHSYRMLNDYPNAEIWYAQAIGLDSTEPYHTFYYAEMLKANGKHDEAIRWMEKYYDMRRDDVRGLRHIENRSYVDQLKLDSASIDINFLSINSDHSDFGASFKSNQQVVFASSRGGSKFLGRKNRRDKTPFFNMYIADIRDWELDNIQVFSEDLTTELHDGPASFSSDGKKVFFTRNVYLKRSRYEERVNRLMILSAIFDGEKWGELETLPFNSEDYSCGHPSLSADGQRLYFSSDMPGGYGETDIYVVERIGDGWDTPRNLGSTVNTPGREMFPFIHNNGTLYFSSDGYATLGGLDILAAEPTNKGFGEPVNLGYPINSPSDDFAFVLSSDGFNGFLSSNRRAMHNDDLYHFTIRPRPPKAIVDFVETERYAQKVKILPLENDVVGDGKVISITDYSASSLKGGEVTFNPGNQEFRYTPPEDFIGVDTIFYTVCDTITFMRGCSSSYIAINIKDVYYGLKGLIVEKGTNTPVEEVRISLLDDSMKPISNMVTEESGTFNFDLLKDKVFYVRLVKDGFNTRNVPVSTVGIAPGAQEIKEVIEIEKLEGLTFELMILFDLGKWNIRPDAAKELDEKAVNFLLENPTVVIELSAHTDSRGSARNNQILSQRRAESAVQYLVSKGIDPKRMRAKGYGEERLLNHCKPGVRCSEEEHQKNRRVEITVLSY